MQRCGMYTIDALTFLAGFQQYDVWSCMELVNFCGSAIINHNNEKNKSLTHKLFESSEKPKTEK